MVRQAQGDTGLPPQCEKEPYIKPTFAGVLADFGTIFDENSRKITIFGGKLRTASPGEFVVSGVIAFIAFVVLGPFSLDTSRGEWKALYDQRIVDKQEFYEHRFKVIWGEIVFPEIFQLKPYKDFT